jgi:ubiquinone/menaquinone biosynthesis C-methylase UbiE
MTKTQQLDTGDLERRIKEVYRHVAEHPEEQYHFEMGRPLAERLGYPTELLDAIPTASLASFAGVGYYLDLLGDVSGHRVLDLGSGSGTDCFAAAHLVGPTGAVTGVDMTPQQLTKAERLRDDSGIDNVRFVEGHIDRPPVVDGSYDAVVSNGVINLCPDKPGVFAAATRALAPGGRLALSDIVTERALTENIVCSAELWASCIGGAAQVDDYLAAIEASGLRVQVVRDNPAYAFLSESAQGATQTFGIKSISLLAVKPL